MASTRISTSAKRQNNTGFGANSTYSAGRFIKKRRNGKHKKKGASACSAA